MPAPVERMDRACHEVLSAVVAHHGGALPERRYVSAGPPVWDCSLVAVWAERTTGYSGDPGAPTAEPRTPGAGYAMRVAQLAVTIVRDAACSDNPPPSVIQEQAAALAMHEDEPRLINALVAAVKADEMGGCRSLAFLDWNVEEPSGGLVGGVLRLQVGLT